MYKTTIQGSPVCIRWKHYPPPQPHEFVRGSVGTVAIVEYADGVKACSTFAALNPKDAFNRQIGTLVAVGRALKMLGYRRPERHRVLTAIKHLYRRHQ